MFIVAITGGISTGKSTVAKVFKDAGVPVVDADLIARQGKRKSLELPRLIRFLITRITYLILQSSKTKTNYT